MYFDNGLFAFAVPSGWSAHEAEDGTVYITNSTDASVWVSVQAQGVQFADDGPDPESFIRRTFPEAELSPESSASGGAQGRFVARWQESRSHEGTQYLLSHSVVACAKTARALQVLVFEAACPSDHASSAVGAEARVIAWGTPAEMHLYSWGTSSAA